MVALAAVHAVASRGSRDEVIRLALIDLRARVESEAFQKSFAVAIQRRLGAWAPKIDIAMRHGPFGDRLDAAIAELLTFRPQIIVAISTRVAAACRRQAPAHIPVIFVAYENPVTAEVVRSLERPATNATGLWNDLDLHCKRVELLTRAFPAKGKLAIVVDHNDARNNAMRRSFEACARSSEEFEVIEINGREELVRLKTRLSRSHSGLVVPHSGLCNVWPDDLVSAVNACNLPSIFDGKWLVDRGALMSLEPIELDEATTLAEIAAKVLRGTPAEQIRIERPRTTRLSVNSETARKLSLILPAWLLIAADDVV